MQLQHQQEGRYCQSSIPQWSRLLQRLLVLNPEVLVQFQVQVARLPEDRFQSTSANYPGYNRLIDRQGRLQHPPTLECSE